MSLAYELNLGKQEAITELYYRFTPLAKTLQNHLLQELHQTGIIKNRPDVKHVDSNGLSERYKYEILANVIGSVRG